MRYVMAWLAIVAACQVSLAQNPGGLTYGSAHDTTSGANLNLGSANTNGILSESAPRSYVDALESGRATAPSAFWFNTEYLVWFIQSQVTPPLIQTIPDNLANSTNLPAGSARTLFPEEGTIGYKAFNGLRFSGGFWFNETPGLGLDFSFFFLDQQSTGASYFSSGSPSLSRPYVDANGGQSINLLFANPDATNGYSGSLAVAARMTSIYGGDISLRWQGYSIFADRTDWTLGFKYLDFRESLDIVGNANLQSGTRLNVADHFATSNQFYGSQVGILSRLGGMYGFSVDGGLKLAIGGMDQQVTINGSNTIVDANGTVSREERGLYAQPTNSGRYSRGMFVFIPEVNFNLNYNLTENTVFFVGYSMMWISNLVRPSSAIDPVVNDSTLRYVGNPTAGNAARPTFTFRGDDFWLQGMTFGLRLEY